MSTSITLIFFFFSKKRVVNRTGGHLLSVFYSQIRLANLRDHLFCFFAFLGAHRSLLRYLRLFFKANLQQVGDDVSFPNLIQTKIPQSSDTATFAVIQKLPWSMICIFFFNRLIFCFLSCWFSIFHFIAPILYNYFISIK